MAYDTKIHIARIQQMASFSTIDAQRMQEVFEAIEGERNLSTDDSTKTGAAVVSPGGADVVAIVHNGLPAGVADRPDRRERPRKYGFWEHAERRAVYACAAAGQSTLGAHLLCSHFPCADCARAVIESGMASITVNGGLLAAPLVARFFDSMRDATEMLNESPTSLSVWFPAVASTSGADIDVLGAIERIGGAGAVDAEKVVLAAGIHSGEAYQHDGRLHVAFRSAGRVAVLRFHGGDVVDWASFGETVDFGSGPVDAAAALIACQF
jgi:dCMP deaminase